MKALSLLGLFAALTFFGQAAFANDGESASFPTFLESQIAARETADYNCVGKCALTYQVRHNGFVNTIRVDVGPVRVTVGSPSENAIHAAAQVALTGMCPSACQSNLPSNAFQQSCRVYGTGPCSRIR